MKEILIAVDGSPSARAAVEEGLELARATDAAVIFLTVRAAPLPLLGDPYYQQALTRSLAHARAAIDEALDAAADAGVTASGEIVEGDPAYEIVAFAQRHGVDLIVIGSRGRGALSSAVLGSVSVAVVEKTHVPVLITGAEARAAA